MGFIWRIMFQFCLIKYVFILITLKIEDGSFRISAASPPSIHPIPSSQEVEMPTIRMTERCGDRSIHVAPSIAVAIRAPRRNTCADLRIYPLVN